MENMIVCLGDSITYGYPYGPQESWVLKASKKLNIPMINKGNNGDTTTDMLLRFSKDVISVKPSHVMIMGGTNDAALGIPLDVVGNNFSKMAAIAKTANINVIFCQPIPADDYVLEQFLDEYRLWLKNFCFQEEFKMIDFSKVFITDGNINLKYLADEVHPNHLGYDKMAKIAIRTLTNILKIFHY